MLYGRSAAELLAWGAAAAFGREPNLAVVGLALLACLGRRRFGGAAALGLAVALWAGWFVLVGRWYGLSPLLPRRGNFAAPFSGMADGWAWVRTMLAWSWRAFIIHGLSLAHAAVQSGRHYVQISGIVLTLTGTAASALDATFGTTLFTPGLELGTASTLIRF